MKLDPDTDIQFRKGGKIMKKMPRKFQAGGQTEAPKTGIELELENVRKDRFTQKGLGNYNAERPTMLGPRIPKPTPPKPFDTKKEEEKKYAKGGRIRKFSEGGDMVTGDTRERRADEKDKPRKEPAPIVNRTKPDEPKSVGGGGGSASTEPDYSPRGGGAGATEPDYAPTKVANEQREKKEAPKAASKPAPKAASKPQELRFPPKIPKPDENYGNEGYGRGKYEPPKLTSEQQAARNKQEREQGLEGVYPEAFLPLARAAGVARSALGRLFGRGAAEEGAGATGTALAREAGPRITRLPDGPRVEMPRAQDLLPGRGRAALPPPAEGSRAALTGRPPMLPSPAARLSAPTRPATPTRFPARSLEEEIMAGEGNPNFFKKGGKVAKYAKGGGVESKGKTKGKIVKMAKGGSVKGWGIARGSRSAKIV